MSWATFAGLIPYVVKLAVGIANAVKGNIDEKRWESLGPEIQTLIEKALNGEDFSHEDLMQYIPEEFELELLQLKKKKERLEQGLPVV